MPVLPAVLLLLGCLTSVAQAQENPLIRLENGLTAQGWEAVGRIDIAGQEFCTGALISERLVLTAAHCLFDRDTGKRYSDEDFLFRAGWRNGRAVAEGRVLRSVVHPDYRVARDATPETVVNDLALLKLVHPMSNRGIVPFAVQEGPQPGDTVGVVSYARGRLDAPSLQDRCRVLDTDAAGVVYTTCSVEFGASGSPVFSFETGQAEIVSIISAKGISNAGDHAGEVAFGLALGPKLDRLRAALNARDRRFIQAPAESAIRTAPRLMTGDGGARFLRP